MMKKLKIGLISLLAAAFLAGPMPAIKARPTKPLEAVVLGVPAASAMETKEEGWPVPDMTGYTFKTSGYLDKDKEKDGVKETLLEIWEDSKGNHINKYITNGITWAYCTVSNPKDPSRDHVIRDPNCDGKFEEKYDPYELFYLPNCAK